MLGFFQKLSPLPIGKLALKLAILMVGLLMLAQMLILIPALPRYHQIEMENRMREFVFMAELHLNEKPQDQKKNAVVVTTANGTQFSLGSEQIINRAKNLTPQIWQTDLFHQTKWALQAIFTQTDNPIAYRINVQNILPPPIQTQLHRQQHVDIIMPANILTQTLRLKIAKWLGIITSLAIIIAIPVAWLAERRIITPLERLISDMTDFANDPYQPRGGMIYSRQDDVISDAQKALDELQRSTRHELIQRDKLASIGEAAAKINHDLRNVLASAMLVSDALEQTDDPKIKKSSQIVKRAIERGATLCSQMLTFIKAPENIKPEKIEISQLIQECAEEISIAINYSGPQQLVVDGGYFFRLIHNIVNNAEKAGAKIINIEIWKAGSYAVMDISDNGPGIPHEMKDLIFKPFTGSTRGSSGLGLCIARDIAVAHGGDLRLSRSNENGSEFRLLLPVETLGEVRPHRFWT